MIVLYTATQLYREFLERNDLPGKKLCKEGQTNSVPSDPSSTVVPLGPGTWHVGKSVSTLPNTCTDKTS